MYSNMDLLCLLSLNLSPPFSLLSIDIHTENLFKYAWGYQNSQSPNRPQA
jgi:hypothetical protein